MLSPEYLDAIGGDILAMYEELNATIVEDIARRIVKTDMVDSTSAYQLSQAQQAGALYEDALQRISEVTGYTTKDLQQLFKEAGTENNRYENDIMQQAGLMPIDLNQSEPMMRQLKAGIIKTSRLINNMTMTTAVTAQTAYIHASTLAYNQVITGAFSYTEAIRRAVLSSASKGLQVLYPTGHRDKLDVAIRRAVLTGVNQTAAKMTEEMAEEADCDYVEVTAHSGARQDHAAWQGKVYCRSGKDKSYPPFRVTGYGTGRGLCGWNCRHSFHMFWPGISDPNYTQEMLDDYNAKNFEWNGKKLSDAECNSIQRGYERGIRETKRQLTACNEAMMATSDDDLKAGFKEDFQKLSVKLKQQERELKTFSQDTLRQSSAGRTSIAVIKGKDGKILGFNKSVAQKAVQASKKARIKDKVIKEKQVIKKGLTAKENVELDSLMSKYKNLNEAMLCGNLEEMTRYKALVEKLKGTASDNNYKEQFKLQNLSSGKLQLTDHKPSSLQYDALSSYTRSGYVEINQYKRFDVYVPEDMKQHAKQLESYLDGCILDKEIYLKRGTNETALNNLLGNSWKEDISKNIGKCIQDKGFVSTTPYNNGGFGGNVMMYIKAPNGTHGAYIEKYAAAESEKEFLIQCNTRMRINNFEEVIDEWGDRKFIVHLEVLNE